MQAVVFHGVGDVRLEDVPDPKIQEPTDAVVRITTSAICGTDLHFVRGTMPGVEEGTILGHEAVGVVEEVGRGVRNFREGDRVVVPSTICCGYCSYCRAGYSAQCDHANPNGPRAGTAFYGGPKANGGFDGLQAEKARIPFACANLVPVPDGLEDDPAILASDIFPTGYFGADLAGVGPGDTVAVFGCGPVGLLAALSARLMGAGRVLAVDCLPDRIEKARRIGAEAVDFSSEDPVEAILEATGGIGTDRAIDAVGVDAEGPDSDPHDRESGAAPGQALAWAVKSLAKAGTLGVIGVYPPDFEGFPFGAAMNRNQTIRAGNCNHRKYVPMLLDRLRTGEVDLSFLVTQAKPLSDVIGAIESFDQRKEGWVKVALETASANA